MTPWNGLPIRNCPWQGQLRLAEAPGARQLLTLIQVDTCWDLRVASNSAPILSVTHGEHFGRPTDRPTVSTKKYADRTGHQERPAARSPNLVLARQQPLIAAHHSPPTAAGRAPAQYVKKRGASGSAPMCVSTLRTSGPSVTNAIRFIWPPH